MNLEDKYNNLKQIYNLSFLLFQVIKKKLKII